MSMSKTRSAALAKEVRVKQPRTVADHSLATQDLLAGAKNYNRWIFDLAQPHLGQRILDIGCSIGNITEYLLDRQCVVGIDCDNEVIKQIRARFASCPNFYASCLDFPNSDLSPLHKFEFDTVTCLNVLEHIADDVLALATIRTLIAGRGRLILLVPALTWLYGSMDAADGHFRRYSSRELREKLTASGFKVNKLQYMNFPGILGWFINGRIRKVPLIPQKQLAFYDRIIPLVQRVEQLIRLPVGQSLIAIAEKNS
jgi:SAM-dependent methyltransferase